MIKIWCDRRKRFQRLQKAFGMTHEVTATTVPDVSEEGSPSEMPFSQLGNTPHIHPSECHDPASDEPLTSSRLQVTGGLGGRIALLGDAVEDGA